MPGLTTTVHRGHLPHPATEMDHAGLEELHDELHPSRNLLHLDVKAKKPTSFTRKMTFDNWQVLLLIIGPQIPFAIFSALYSYGFYYYPMAVIQATIFFTILVVIHCVLFTKHYKRTRVFDGLLIVGIVLGSLFGLFNYFQNSVLMAGYQSLRPYSNVNPSQSADKYLDAGRLDFATTAGVDIQNAAGTTTILTSVT